MTEATGPADDTSKTEGAAEAAKNEPTKVEPTMNEAIKNEAADSEAETPKAAASAKGTGTSLAPATDKPSGIDPFIAIAAAEAPATAAAPRPFYAKALDYSAHAAMAIGLIGFAWTVSDHVVSRPVDTPAAAVKHADADTATPSASAQKPVEVVKVDPVDELRKTNQKMASEIRNLRASLEALRTTVVRERTSSATPDESRAEIRALSASIDNLKSSLAGTKNEQGTTLAQLSAKLEKLQREEKAAPIVERKPERQQLDTSTTASIPSVPKAVPTPPSKPTTLASVEPEAPAADKPQVIAGWVVRDVYQGVALIEGHRGQMEVVPGVSIPGAGTVKSIERHNGAWTVTTTKGQFASAAPQQHEPSHHGYRDYYGPRRWDF